MTLGEHATIIQLMEHSNKISLNDIYIYHRTVHHLIFIREAFYSSILYFTDNLQIVRDFGAFTPKWVSLSKLSPQGSGIYMEEGAKDRTRNGG